MGSERAERHHGVRECPVHQIAFQLSIGLSSSRGELAKTRGLIPGDPVVRLESLRNTGIRITSGAGINSCFAWSDKGGVSSDDLTAFERKGQRPPIQLVHVQGWAIGASELKVNGIRGCRMPFFLALPNLLVHVLESRN